MDPKPEVNAEVPSTTLMSESLQCDTSSAEKDMEPKSQVKDDVQSSTTLESSPCETSTTLPKDVKPKTETKSLAFILAFASIMASNFISIMDTVIVATALPAIAHGLNAKSNQAYWLGSGFLFAQAVSQPLYGTMSSVFGRKPCFVFSMALFTVASVFCATAQNVAWLIGARVFQGLGSGGILVVGSIIITDMVSLHERGKYIGILAFASALGLVSGILMGAAIGGLASWRMYVVLPPFLFPFCGSRVDI